MPSLNGFRSRRELADGEIQVPVDDSPFWRPVICARSVVIEKSCAGREAKHGKQPGIRQPFAQARLVKHRIHCNPVDLANELQPHKAQELLPRIAEYGRRGLKQYITGPAGLSLVRLYPIIDQVPNCGSCGSGGRQRPPGRGPELAMHAVGAASVDLQCFKGLPQNFLHEHAFHNRNAFPHRHRAPAADRR